MFKSISDIPVGELDDWGYDLGGLMNEAEVFDAKIGLAVVPEPFFTFFKIMGLQDKRHGE